MDLSHLTHSWRQMSWRTCLLWRHRSIHFMCAGLRARTRNASAVSGICGRTSSNVPQEDTRRLGAAWWRQSRHPSADAPRQNHWFWADVRLLSSVDKLFGWCSTWWKNYVVIRLVLLSREPRAQMNGCFRPYYLKHIPELASSLPR